MKNIFKKIYKSAIVVVLLGFFALNTFVPVFKVNADDNYVITIEVENENEYSLSIGARLTITRLSNNANNLVDVRTVTGADISNEVTTVCQSATHCTITIPNEKGSVVLNANYQDFDVTNGNLLVGANTIFSSSVTLTVKTPSVNSNTNPGEPSNRPGFNGTAYFLWNCNGNVCVYRKDDLELKTDGTHGVNANDPYIVNYIKESDVKNGNDENGTVLEIDNLGEGDYFWTWDTPDFMERLAYAGIQQSTIDEINTAMGEIKTWKDLQDFVNYLEHVSYDAKRAFAIDPTGGKNGENSISTNGDRCFRATIYDETKYEGIIFGVSEDDYTYFLSSWDPAFINPELDISGTSKENPAFYEIYMLEPNLKFTLNNSRKVTNIKSIKPVDINKDAVTITENSGEYTIKFNSNFYNEVMFEVTGENNNKYYFVVYRTVGDIWENVFDPEAENLMVGVNLLYPDTDSYDDYQIIANITYKDGTFKTVEANNIKTYQDLYNEGNDHMAYVNEWHDGKGLKGASYGIEITDDVTDLYFTAIKKDALSSDNYGGTFAGAGQGFKFDRLKEVLHDWSMRGETGE